MPAASRRTNSTCCPRRTARCLFPEATRRAATIPLIGRRARGRRRGALRARRRRARETKRLLPLRRRPPFADHRWRRGAPTPAVRNISRLRVRDWAGGADLADVIEETDAAVVWSARFKVVLLRQARRQPPADAGLCHVLGTYRSPPTRWSTRSALRLVHPHHESASGAAFCVIAGGDHETSEQRLIDLAARGRPRRGLVAARGGDRRAVFGGRRGRRRIVHPHQCRRRHRLQDRHGAARRGPRAPTGAT